MRATRNRLRKVATAPSPPGPHERVAKLGQHVVEAQCPALPAPGGHQGHAPLHQLPQQQMGRGGAGLARRGDEDEIGPPVGQRRGLVELLEAGKELDRAPLPRRRR